MTEAAIDITDASRRWQKALGTVALIIGVLTVLSVLGIIFNFDPIIEGLLAVGAVTMGAIAAVLLVKDWTRIGLILLALFLGGFAIFSIAGILWEFILRIGTDVLTWLFNPGRVDPTKIVAC